MAVAGCWGGGKAGLVPGARAAVGTIAGVEAEREVEELWVRTTVVL